MAEAPHRRRTTVRRLPAVAVLGTGLVLGLVLGHGGARRAGAPPAIVVGSAAAPADALSSSWFCAGATDARKGVANARLLVTNAGHRSLQARIRIVSDRSAARTLTVPVGPAASVLVPEALAGGAPWVGATVQLDGGQASVEQETSGPLGPTVEACATTSSRTWYFAAGQTLVNATSTISLLNPDAAPAIVDLSFTTDQGEEQPGGFQGLIVPPGGLVEVPLGSHLRRRRFIATTVRATAGAVVAWKTDVVEQPAKGAVLLGTAGARSPLADPASPYPSVTDVLGAPSPATRWWWPDGATGAGTVEQYEVYNPGAVTARVALSVALDQGSAEPFTLTVGPGQVATLPTSAAARIPAGVAYAASLRSLNGVPVVAERTVEAARPAAPGSAELLGATEPAHRWLVGAPRVGWDHQLVLTVAGTSGKPAVVTVDQLVGGRLVAVQGIGAVHIGPQAPLVIDFGRLPAPPTGPIVVQATEGVVVARQLLGTERLGAVTASLGVPLPG